MSVPTRPDKARAREVLETRVRTRLAQLSEVLTRELTPPYHAQVLVFDRQTHRLTGTHPQGSPYHDPLERGPFREIPLADALTTIRAEAEAIVTHTVTAIWARVHSPLVPGALRAAVLGREDLVRRWPWDEHHDASAVLTGLLWWLDTVLDVRFGDARTPFGGEPKPGGWPADVAPRAVADWAEPILKDEREALAHFRATVEAGAWGQIDHLGHALAALYAVLRLVEQDRDEQHAIAIDAGRPHHDLLMGWRDLPKDTRTPRETPISNGRIELLAPGDRCVQLTLDLDGEGSPSEALITALRDWRGWKGLRHWAAVQRLLSVEGGRQGWVRWTLDGHLNALGVSVKNRSKADLRANVARQVEAFTKIEIAVYAADGTLRSRRPILLVIEKFDRLQGSAWELDGMQLTINPLLYGGVREDGGRLGRNWYPAPVELAAVDHVHHPHTLALGFFLPIRWRRALDEGQHQDHLTHTGESALRMAGIPYKAHDRQWLAKHAARAWDALERDLEELKRIKGLGRWEWDAADTPRTLAGRLHFWPAPWTDDRIRHGVRPRELPPGPAVLTGAELKAWRIRHGLTQVTAAAQLKVSRDSILRAEKQPTEPLSTALTAKLRSAGT